MRNFMLTLLMLVGMTAFAQETEPKVLDWDNPTVTIDNTTYTLIDVDVNGNHVLKFNRFTEEGELVESGLLKNRKPHGTWKSYDPNGNVTTIAEFKDGKRIKLKSLRRDGTTYTVLYKSSVLQSPGDRVAQVIITY